MTNMSYCKYENTYNALRDCQQDMDTTTDKQLSMSELKFRKKLIQVCMQISDDWGETDG